MNRKKLNIIKKVLNVHKWELKEDRNRFPNIIFVFGGNGNCIMEFHENNRRLFYDHNLIHQKIQCIFGFNGMEINELMGNLMGNHFGWEGVIPDHIPWKGIRWIENYFKGNI